jgi:large subunit ribosomal protein L10
MDKQQKEAAVKEIGSELEASTAVFAVDYRGISVPQAAELRTKLREADASFNVVKNRLAKRVTADAGAEALDEHLTGPTALTYVKGDPVLAAKAITDFIRQHETISYKGGIMEGKALDPDGFKEIARLPGVDVLRGQLVGLAAAPLTGVVRSLNGLIQGLASQLGQIADQGLVSGEAPKEEAAPETEEAPSEEAAADADAGDDDAGEAPPADEPAGSDEPAADAEPVTEGDAEQADADDSADGESETSETEETDNQED